MLSTNIEEIAGGPSAFIGKKPNMKIISQLIVLVTLSNLEEAIRGLVCRACRMMGADMPVSFDGGFRFPVIAAARCTVLNAEVPSTQLV